METIHRDEGSSRDRVRAPRFKTTQKLCVYAKTIGTDLVYKLEAENMSRSGLLLNWDQTRPIPFLENTILEMTIDPECHFLEKSVQFLGKVVRRINPRRGSACLEFGINIIQIDDHDLDEWEVCITGLMSSGAEMVTVNPAPEKEDKKYRKAS